MHTEFALDKERCWAKCKSFDSCNWFSFIALPGAKDSICQMFETCSKIESNWLFVSGQKECKYDTESGEWITKNQSLTPMLPKLVF